MEHGHWLLDSVAKTITLAATGGNKTVFKIVALSAKELIVINKGEANNSTMKFVSSGKHYRDATEDPFHFSNNQWRIAPSKAETDEAIKKRLKAFLHFHILFYRDNIAKGEKTISFYGFPTCIKWYAGGIYVIKDELLPGSWFGCFYNKAQALKAKTLMQEIVTKKYKWQNSGVSWVIKNLDVLEQMYAAM